jgi:apolipoprotein N-acyltransferase
VVGFYDKEHLVPFGEYVPLGEWLPLGKLVESVGDFSSGRNQRAPSIGDIALGVLVCYEGIFPELAQKRVEEGATLLVNISNDAWFGDSSAPWQHLQLSLLRAVEQGRWLARATNTGISLLADPQGRITARSGLFTEDAVTGPSPAGNRFDLLPPDLPHPGLGSARRGGVSRPDRPGPAAQGRTAPKTSSLTRNRTTMLQYPELKSQGTDLLSQFASLWRRL